MAAARSNLRMGLPFSFGIKCIQDNWTSIDIPTARNCLRCHRPFPADQIAAGAEVAGILRERTIAVILCIHRAGSASLVFITICRRGNLRAIQSVTNLGLDPG